MWQLFREPIEKEYYAKGLSRSWLLAAACSLFAFLTPLLVLVSIGYSWDEYKLSLIQPVLTFQNYQATCLLSTGLTTYDSSFNNELSANSHQSFVSAGGSGSDLLVSASFLQNNFDACTFQLYFKVVISNRIPTIAVLPLHFYKQTTSTLLLSSVSEVGTIEVKNSYAVPQSSVDSGTGMQYYVNGSQALSMVDAHKSYAVHKNLTLIPSISSSQVGLSTTATSMSYEGRFKVLGSQYIEEISLLQNLRNFVPFLVYLLVVTWVFLSQPTVRWMLENKIYQSKVQHHKIKQH